LRIWGVSCGTATSGALLLTGVGLAIGVGTGATLLLGVTLGAGLTLVAGVTLGVGVGLVLVGVEVGLLFVGLGLTRGVEVIAGMAILMARLVAHKMLASPVFVKIGFIV
jgi:hypothetical protein